MCVYIHVCVSNLQGTASLPGLAHLELALQQHFRAPSTNACSNTCVYTLVRACVRVNVQGTASLPGLSHLELALQQHFRAPSFAALGLGTPPTHTPHTLHTRQPQPLQAQSAMHGHAPHNQLLHNQLLSYPIQAAQAHTPSCYLNTGDPLLCSGIAGGGGGARREEAVDDDAGVAPVRSVAKSMYSS
jgi:hypothetical protein